MAEILLKDKILKDLPQKNIKVSSAGFIHNDEPASQPAEQLMKEWGLDLSFHLSTRVTRKLVAAQDLILTMEEEQVERILELNEPRPHVESIISYASNGKTRGDIKDPYGCPKADYETVATQLKELITMVVNRLQSVL
jgi:protein-tyrosine-phosphatase